VNARALIPLLAVIAIAWLALLMAAPVGLAQARWQTLAVAVYEIGGRICHQRPERSFHLDGVQLPVCARCFGLYVSGAIGLTFAWLGRGKLSVASTRAALALSALPIAITVAGERLGAMAPSNVSRMMTGLPLGFVAGLVIVATLRASHGAHRLAAAKGLQQ